MNHLADYQLYEYISLPREEQEVMAMEIVKEWLSWGYKSVKQSKFLFLKHLFPELVSFNTLYRGIDVNYLEVPIDEVRDHIWHSDKGRYVSWCKDLKHNEQILSHMKNTTGSTYYTIIKQKSMGISVMDAVSLLQKTSAYYHHKWNLDLAVEMLSDDKISEVVAPLTPAFTIEGVMVAMGGMGVMMDNTKWRVALPNILANGKSTSKWQRDITKKGLA